MQKGSPAVILLSASHDEEREVLFNVLAGQGYSVHKFEKTDDPLVSYHQVSPDFVIIADIGSGFLSSDSSKRLKEEADAEEIPVLFICNKDSSLESLAGSDGIIDYLRRPFEREDILARIKILLKVRQQMKELQEIKERLHSAQKLECVGALAAGVAHEFNNMMCSVLGFAELALQDDATDVAALKESAEISCETAKRATAAARSLLAFSRQATSAKAMGNLNDAILAAVRLLMRDMEKSGIKIIMELGELPEINFAIGSMQQVFLNLIINSWHAMTDWNGEKTVKIRSWAEEGQRVYASVADTGIGIPKSRHEKIFEAFFTTKTGETGNVKGSGLGLAIIKEVIRDHGGAIRVNSEEGKGAEFIITLPVESVIGSPDQGHAFNTDAFTLPYGRKYSVIVIDDEDQNRKAIARLLKKNGHKVISASSMAEAVPLLWSNKLDLIVLDLIMPGPSGDENVRNLRDQGLEIPIMICTGHVDDVAIKKALDAGANGVVTKPFSGSEFLSEMHACISGEKSRDVPGKN